MSFQSRTVRVVIGCAATLAFSSVTGLYAQVGTATQSSGAPKPPATAPALPAGVTPPSGYVIGADDQLTVNFWRDKDMSSDVIVRPDGKITLPLLNEIQAAGLTPDELRAAITKAAMKFVTEEPTVSVIVRQINSRFVYIQGMVGKTGKYQLPEHMTVVQLIATAGGLAEYADKEHIQIVRVENGQPKSYFFNYKDFAKGRPAALKQNIELKIGDTVIVP